MLSLQSCRTRMPSTCRQGHRWLHQHMVFRLVFRLQHMVFRQKLPKHRSSLHRLTSAPQPAGSGEEMAT